MVGPQEGGRTVVCMENRQKHLLVMGPQEGSSVYETHVKQINNKEGSRYDAQRQQCNVLLFGLLYL